MLPTPLAALFAPAAVHTELTYERIRFDPVPVYIGPAPGWKGPALGAHGDDRLRRGGSQDHVRRRFLNSRDG